MLSVIKFMLSSQTCNISTLALSSSSFQYLPNVCVQQTHFIAVLLIHWKRIVVTCVCIDSCLVIWSNTAHICPIRYHGIQNNHFTFCGFSELSPSSLNWMAGDWVYHFFEVKHFTGRCLKFMQFVLGFRAVMTPHEEAHTGHGKKKSSIKDNPLPSPLPCILHCTDNLQPPMLSCH